MELRKQTETFVELRMSKSQEILEATFKLVEAIRELQKNGVNLPLLQEKVIDIYQRIEKGLI